MRESYNPELSAEPSAAATDAPRHRPSFFAEAIRAELRDRTIGGLVDLPGPTWRLIHIDNGAVVFRDGDTPRRIPAPAFIWCKGPPAQQPRAQAGTQGVTVLMGDTMLVNTVGHRPEAADIRLMLDRDFEVDLAEHTKISEGIRASLAQMLAEQALDQPGGAAIAEAHARIVMVLIWRLVSSSDALPVSPRLVQSRELQRFRQLLEAHFRERWQVAQYARALSMSTDRLNDLCQRHVGRPPSRLIRERLVYEACLLLERSSHTNEQIAGLLGFNYAGQFSRIFKAETGLPPGRYRSRSRQSGPASDDAERAYSDWP